MGMQCSIILTYYTLLDVEEVKKNIYSFLELPYSADRVSEVLNEGDRDFQPADMQYQIFSIKNWEEKECKQFIKNLRTLKWDYPRSVQVYYLPGTNEDYERFKLVNLFENI